MTGSVFSQHEQATDLKNTNFYFQILVKPRNLVAKHYMRIVKYKL